MHKCFNSTLTSYPKKQPGPFLSASRATVLTEKLEGECFPQDFGSPSAETMLLCCQLPLPCSPCTEWDTSLAIHSREEGVLGGWLFISFQGQMRWEGSEPCMHTRYTLVKSYRRHPQQCQRPQATPLTHKQTHTRVSSHTDPQKLGRKKISGVSPPLVFVTVCRAACFSRLVSCCSRC